MDFENPYIHGHSTAALRIRIYFLLLLESKWNFSKEGNFQIFENERLLLFFTTFFVSIDRKSMALILTIPNAALFKTRERKKEEKERGGEEEEEEEEKQKLALR